MTPIRVGLVCRVMSTILKLALPINIMSFEYSAVSIILISAGADGVLAPGSAHTRPSAQALIDTSGNFSAQVSKRG